MKKDKVIFIDTNRERVKYKELEELLNLIGMYVYEGNAENENLEELDFSSIQEIEDIYNKYELFQASLSLKCIANSGVKELYFKASKELERLGTYESMYATLYCKTKAKGYYSVEELLEEGYKIASEYPNKSKIRVLLGDICNLTKEYKMNGIENYKQGLTIAQDEIYRASILYKSGKSSEGIEQLEKLKNDAYERADSILPTYKTKYKVARQYMEIGVIDVAIEYFKESLRKIEEYGKYLDPIEQEYTFKIYSHLASLYNSKRDYIETINYGEKAIDLKNRIYDSKGEPNGYNKLYYEIYKGKSNIDGIISEVLKGMNIYNVYHHLGVAYEGLGLRDISEEYFKLVRVS